MERSNLEKYYSSMAIFVSMKNAGVLSTDDYLKAEALIAEKYCIKKGNLYRLIDLIIVPKRVINTSDKKEVSNECNENRSITKITRKN